MRTDHGAIVIVGWVLAVLTLSSAKKVLSLSEKEGLYFRTDSIQQKKTLFRKEYKEKLDILESTIIETRNEITKKKSQQQAQWNKELDALEASRKELLAKLETSDIELEAHWDQFAQEIRDGYDETESKVRNFFKNR